MSNYTEFFLGSKSSAVQIECLEISHSNFSQTYRVVRNAVDGITVTHEDGMQYAYEYYPLKIKENTSRANLDYGFDITLGDLGELIPNEIDAIRAADNFSEKPIIYYRTYSSELLTEPLFGPVKLEIKDFPFVKEGVQFTARAPSLNINKTGEIQTVGRFEMLRGFI